MPPLRDGQGGEAECRLPDGAYFAALSPDVGGVAEWAMKPFARLFDAKESKVLDEILFNEVVAEDTEASIE